MNVVAVRHVENCFDGSFIKELLLSDAVSERFIRALAQNGRLQYFPEFARPFYKVRAAGKFDVKGIGGNTAMRVHLKNPDDYSLDEFVGFIEGLPNGVALKEEGPQACSD